MRWINHKFTRKQVKDFETLVGYELNEFLRRLNAGLKNSKSLLEKQPWKVSKTSLRRDEDFADGYFRAVEHFKEAIHDMYTGITLREHRNRKVKKRGAK